ncbi:STAR-related lipid transfer (START) domain containing protein 6, isoform CRA_a [Rattus norvegicus]|uniref:STAR-related lipid transfer (START) domain containing protein 6, isoform CRA_a n=1 Tax=Rattus norvegicus TaxID=10116 RepID=Q6AYN5_RAT|nr:stAR-related lipid transfer protein 6 [Rattus norvegicus]XP_006254983.1 stAR-related lipid transfer protein 6 isoform X1 [Rattus norvegicus]XP_008770334.1 stAR-related lipid transfer protein 6 isoform X1 [Rattus norvegicus]AAH78976.1 StAR-related lipid transfer (START) domain containing 6 [Rattus norvegicus]EDM14781.1 STAR-related lipid transfer (START) domain containing protein 6, isoform CRA_a [Rattus norvegicus]EDM14783.1 STAR-related lipid transfer (START) domain containing protein 6, i|eukprot:NP_001007628.1 stAR-related lipid transfer protein 6 [Rattus norvegicus]
MDYKAIAQQSAEQVLAYNQDLSGWKVVKTSKKVTVSSKASKLFQGNLYRIEGVIPELPAHLSDFLYKSEHRVSWDKSLKAFNMIHKIDSDTLICHTITQSFAMGSISPRDFIDLVHIKHQDGNMDIISTRSVEFPGYPPTSHYIRGYNHPSGYVCSPLKENPAYSKLVVFVQTEMKGKLLASVIEKSMPSNLVSFFLNVKDGLKIHKAPIPALRSHHSMHSAVHKKK